MARARWAHLARFEPAPILNVHLWFDRPVADFAFAAFIRSEVQWAFNRSRLGGEDEAARQHLVISISAPGELFALGREELLERLLPQLCGRRSRRLATPELLHCRAVKEPGGDVRARAGAGASRPAHACSRTSSSPAPTRTRAGPPRWSLPCAAGLRPQPRCTRPANSPSAGRARSRTAPNRRDACRTMEGRRRQQEGRDYDVATDKGRGESLARARAAARA